MSSQMKYEAMARKAAKKIIYGHEKDLRGHQSAMEIVFAAALKQVEQDTLENVLKIIKNHDNSDDPDHEPCDKCGVYLKIKTLKDEAKP